MFVLALPLSQGWKGLALFAFLGGLSAATSMIIVETVALSTMVSNDLVIPALLRLNLLKLDRHPDLTRLLLGIRRTAILMILLMGYGYFRFAGSAYALGAIGLISFAAVAQFAPALIGGIFWSGGTRRGAITGLVARDMRPGPTRSCCRRSPARAGSTPASCPMVPAAWSCCGPMRCSAWKDWTRCRTRCSGAWR